MFGFGKKLKEYNLPAEELAKLNFAKITTSKGVIWIEFFKNETPNTVANFSELAKNGFYNGLNFHRVIKGFMAQGGCPNKLGNGGPGWSIKCEVNQDKQVHNRGSISMAHAGRDTGGSQFFICFVACPHLDRHHTVFGEINKTDKSSFDVLDKITQGDEIISIEILEVKD